MGEEIEEQRKESEVEEHGNESVDAHADEDATECDAECVRECAFENEAKERKAEMESFECFRGVIISLVSSTVQREDEDSGSGVRQGASET